MKSIKIGLLSPHYAYNYGAVLQAFALKTFLRQRGYNAIILNRRPTYQCAIPSFMGRMARKLEELTKSNSFGAFEKKYLQPQTEPIIFQKDWENLNRFNLDTVIVGSDQIWRDDYCFSDFGYNFFLDCIDGNKIKKIAYAPSLGKESWNAPSEKEAKVKSLLQDFTAISVREKSSIGILKEKFGVPAQLVLDPTMLLNADDYHKQLSIDEAPSHYIACYILDYSDFHKNLLNTMQQDLKMKCHKIVTRKSQSKIKGLLNRFRIVASIANWVENIANSEFVVTNSFHGMVFSIIFRKQFMIIMNSNRGAARFRSLLSMFGLEDRLLNDDMSNYKSIIAQPIDYAPINPIIIEWQRQSFEFLNKNLSS